MLRPFRPILHSDTSLVYDETSHHVVSVDTPALLLRTLLEDGGGRLRRQISSIKCYVLLWQQFLYGQDNGRGNGSGGTIIDPEGIMASWNRIAPTIKHPPPESLAARILKHVGLSTSTSTSTSGRSMNQEPVRYGIPERVVAAILILCTNLQHLQMICPPWHSSASVPGMTEPMRYVVLDSLLREAWKGDSRLRLVERNHAGEENDEDTASPLQKLHSVTFTGMAGLRACSANYEEEELCYSDDPCPGSYVARGDVCPALTYAPGVVEIATHGTKGGWYDFMQQDGNPHDRSSSGGSSSAELETAATTPATTMTTTATITTPDRATSAGLTRVHVSSPSLDHELLALFRLGAFDDLPRLQGRDDTMRDIAIAQPLPWMPQESFPSSLSESFSSSSSSELEPELEPTSMTISTAPTLTSSATTTTTTAQPLSLSILDRGLSQHAQSLRRLDLGRCWNLGGGGCSARPLRVLPLLTGLEELSIALPLVATNRELWRFYLLMAGAGGDDYDASSPAAAAAVEGMARLTAAVHEVLGGSTPDGERTEMRAAVLDRAGFTGGTGGGGGGTGGENGPAGQGAAGWEWDLPFLRSIPASIKRLCITDSVDVPESAYLARHGEYGSGNGIPDFTQQLVAVPDNGGGGGDGDGAGGAETDENVPCIMPRRTLARLEKIAAAEQEHLGDFLRPPDEHARLAIELGPPSPGCELAHKALLPLALRRFADVCRVTHPRLESMSVCVDRPLLEYKGDAPDPAGQKEYQAGHLVYGAEELAGLFAEAGIAFGVTLA
ncbi:uncharacterized protein B0I36DRAFT_369450 [Microdochium trichocladiopsis]|uniref:Uncharacterized protein n=1 Tax=Microdochium trichocladiopsis TaxID=1682393 RepID=A0A9P8XSB4_9PEZI|nr:uncharacterized protein B0I36DRAFT_369450 [Microdochium trichocladiopsis]KAH7014497.1 hypothetical protein B0I36DRAFT_369450 [Microdochium trichocladiopsis]